MQALRGQHSCSACSLFQHLAQHKSNNWYLMDVFQELNKLIPYKVEDSPDSSIAILLMLHVEKWVNRG